VKNERKKSGGAGSAAGGLAGWMLARLRGARRAEPRLKLLERIALAPRQTLALVEAEGRRFLVATSTDGAPAFYPLDERMGKSLPNHARPARHAAPYPGPQPAARVSW